MKNFIKKWLGIRDLESTQFVQTIEMSSIKELLKENKTIVEQYIKDNYVICEKSKALIKKSDAVVGKSEIRLKNDNLSSRLNNTYNMLLGLPLEEEIYTPHYSPAFAPKKK